MTQTAASLAPTRRTLTAKVPQVTAVFWLAKLLTTGMGEALSDALVGVNQYAAVLAGFVGFVVLITAQVLSRRYHAWLYWGTVAMVAVFGTMAADVVHVGLGISYQVTTLAYAAAVAVALGTWRLVEGCVDVHSVTTRRRELFYWATVLATFALGTAAGDLSAYTLHLGYAPSILLFAALMLVPLLGWRTKLLGSVVAFWTAYVLTRPVGASIADWLGKPRHPAGGVGLGDGPVAAVALVLFVALVAWIAATKRDAPQPGALS